LPKGSFDLPIPGHWNSFIFVHQGDLVYNNGTKVDTFSCCVLEKSGKAEEVLHRFRSEKGARFVLIGGQPLGEPIAQHGPFVMNTQ
jgi:redox-sensitive bicupin YhaK (pirin superfamily)